MSQSGDNNSALPPGGEARYDASRYRDFAEAAADWFFEMNENLEFTYVSDGHKQMLGLDPERGNVHGGAVALGHPIGASGARILVTLLHAMEQRGARRGCAGICLGGGEATAIVVERPA